MTLTVPYLRLVRPAMRDLWDPWAESACNQSTGLEHRWSFDEHLTAVQVVASTVPRLTTLTLPPRQRELVLECPGLAERVQRMAGKCTAHPYDGWRKNLLIHYAVQLNQTLDNTRLLFYRMWINVSQPRVKRYAPSAAKHWPIYQEYVQSMDSALVYRACHSAERGEYRESSCKVERG